MYFNHMKNLLIKVISIISVSLLIVSCSSGTGQDDLGRINKFGAVVSDDTYSAHIGREIMRSGGNAVDAIISMAMVSSISSLSRISMASAGRCLIWQPGTKHILKVSTALDSDYKNDLPMLQIILALYSKYGSLPWAQLILPAEHTALGGVLVSKEMLSDIKATDFVNSNSKSYFLKKGSTEPKEGELIRIEPIIAVLSKLRSISITPNDNRDSSKDVNLDLLSNANIVSSLMDYINDDDSENSKARIVINWQKFKRVYNLAGWDYFASTDKSYSLSGLRHIWQIANNKKWLKNNWGINQVELLQEELSTNRIWQKIQSSDNTKYNTARFINRKFTQENNIISKSDIIIKSDRFKTIKFTAVDYYGLAVSCTFSLGKAFGTAEMVNPGGFFLPDNANQAINESGEWFVIDLKKDKFIASFMAGNKESIFPAARATIRVMLTGDNLSSAFRVPRFSLSRDLKSVYYESDLDIKSYNELNNMGFELIKNENLGSISGIFCPAGLPRDEKLTICMAESDIKKSGNGYVRFRR